MLARLFNEVPRSAGTRRIQRSDPFADLPSIGVSVVGRECAGKTTIFNMLYQTTGTLILDSRLSFGGRDPLEEGVRLDKVETVIRDLKDQGIPSTVATSAIEWLVYAGHRPVLAVKSQEVVGQILTRTRPDSPPDLKKLYGEYLGFLADADVLWAVIPCPPSDMNAADRERLQRDLATTRSYLRAALNARTAKHPSSVVVVLTKVDGMFETAEQARAQLDDRTLTRLVEPLVNVCLSDAVSQVAICPVSAVGFGNAVRMDGTNDAQRSEPRTDEPGYRLGADATTEPFNLATLLVYSMVAGLMPKEVDAESPSGKALVQTLQRLTGDLNALNGWLVPVKKD